MEYIQTVLAQDFGFSDEETMKSLQDCLRKLHVRFLILKVFKNSQYPMFLFFQKRKNCGKVSIKIRNDIKGHYIVDF